MNFIESIKNYAIEDYKTSGVLPSITIAQAILESGWGKSQLAIEGNNLFGIKKGNWSGDIITLPTKEYINNNWITVQADFRKYHSYLESIKDHSELLNNSWYREVIQATDYIGQAKALQNCGYATDNNYSNLLIQIIEENQLYLFDNVQIGEIKESKKFKVIVDVLNVRNRPSTKIGDIVAKYYKGETFVSEGFIYNDGYVWRIYTSYQGKKRYIATRTIDNKEIYTKTL